MRLQECTVDEFDGYSAGGFTCAAAGPAKDSQPATKASAGYKREAHGLPDSRCQLLSIGGDIQPLPREPGLGKERKGEGRLDD